MDHSQYHRQQAIQLIVDIIPIDDVDARRERAEKIVDHLIKAVKEQCTYKDSAGSRYWRRD